MNTNSNTYTVVYTAIVVILVAALLSFVSLSLKDKQDANIKAETISQMLTAAQYGTKKEITDQGNDNILKQYSENIKEAFTVNAKGEKVRDLSTELGKIELADGLKAQNKLIKDGNTSELELPVYIFSKDGKDVTVVAVYGAGLWGPVWGYLGIDEDGKTVLGAYFDHEGETPGVGAKIKDDPAFQAEFIGKTVAFGTEKPLQIVKGAQGDSQVDAISGATMTGNGLSEAIATWLRYYAPYFYFNYAQPEVEPMVGDETTAEGEAVTENEEK